MRAAARIFGACAAGLWIVSWFLPVIENTPGWVAFYEALTGPFRADFPTQGEDAVIQLMSASTNAGFVVLITHWFLDRITRPTMFLKVSLACLLINLYWLVEAVRAGEWTSLLAGYYTWEASFALLLAIGVISVVSARRTSKTPTGGTPA